MKNGVFWMLRRVALVRTDVSEELRASFIRATRISKLGTTLAVTSNRRRVRRNTKVLIQKTHITYTHIYMSQNNTTKNKHKAAHKDTQTLKDILQPMSTA
jgi:hypothetical protein